MHGLDFINGFRKVYDRVSLIWRRVATRFIGFESVEVDGLC